MTNEERSAMWNAAKSMMNRAADLDNDAHNMRNTEPIWTPGDRRRFERMGLDAKLFRLCAGVVRRLIEKDEQIDRMMTQIKDLEIVVEKQSEELGFFRGASKESFNET